jgi:hypothetical protein
MLVGYARVSTLDRNLDLQRDALTKARCEKLCEEKKSAKAGTKRSAFEMAPPIYVRPTYSRRRSSTVSAGRSSR